MANTSKETYLSAKQVQEIIPFSRATIHRLSKNQDSDFPKSHKVGRSVYWTASSIYKYLSDKTGVTVEPDDRVMTAKELRGIFNKSHTWIWQNIKAKKLPKPFLINRSRFWMQSQIEALTSDESRARNNENNSFPDKNSSLA